MYIVLWDLAITAKLVPHRTVPRDQFLKTPKVIYSIRIIPPPMHIL